MKIEAPVNPNYTAIVVKLQNIITLDNCDNVVASKIGALGGQAILSKDHQIGDMGIVFPAETQLSDEFCKVNNLYRHTDLNKDQASKAGYMEDNCRVRAMKFRGNESNCLFLPLESLEYTKINISELHEGDTFDKLNNHEICKKYQLKTKVARIDKNKNKVFKRVDDKFLPLHYDTENFFRNYHNIPKGATVTVTQKLHGTSIRIGNTVVQRRLKFAEVALKKLGVKIQETEYDHVSGSKRVIKDPNNPNQKHFYASDIWSEEGQKLNGLLPEGFVVYGELIGWTKEGAAIQQNYTYCIPHGEAELYVYRVAFVNTQGLVTDLPWEFVKEFCKDRELKTVPELWKGSVDELIEEVDAEGTMMIQKIFLDKRFINSGFPQAVPLEPNTKLVDEGVCVRFDKIGPMVYKAKSPIFLRHETDMLDNETVDLEAEASVAV